MIEGRAELPELTVFTNGALTLRAGASVHLPKLANIDGTGLIANAGSEIRVPLAQSYRVQPGAYGPHGVFQANGHGAVIDLSAINNFVGGETYNSRLRIEAINGGSIDLRKVDSIADPNEGDARYRNVDVIADGPDSEIRFDALTQFTDIYGTDFGEGLYSTLAARNSGTIVVPNLTSLRGINIEFDGRGALPYSQLKNMASSQLYLSGNQTWVFTGLESVVTTAIHVIGGRAEFPQLASLTYGQLKLEQGASVSLPEVSNIDGTSLFAGPNSIIRLPRVTQYNHAASGGSQFLILCADGIGAEIDLSSVVAVEGGQAYNSRISIEARNGGRIDLRKVVSISDPVDGDLRYRHVSLTAEGSRSEIRLDELRDLQRHL